MADLYHYVKKWLFKAFFAQIRLADTELVLTRSHRQIKALTLLFRPSLTLSPSDIAKGKIRYKVYDKLILILKNVNMVIRNYSFEFICFQIFVPRRLFFISITEFKIMKFMGLVF